MAADLVIRNCTLVNADGIRHAGVAVEEGRIVAIARDEDLPAAARAIDAKGNYVIPGFVDAHMHLEWPPGIEPVDNIRMETRASAAGGVTTVIHLLAPAENTLEKLKSFIGVYEKNAYVDLSLSTRIYTREDIKQIRQLADHGVRAFKLLLPYKGPEAHWKGLVGGIDDGIVFLTMQEVARLCRQGYPLFVRLHCENVEIFFKLKEQFLEEKKIPSSWNEVRPRCCEEESLRKCIYLSKLTGCPIYVVHASVREAVNLVAQAKGDGVPVTAETCVQYLTLNTNNTHPVYSKANPPIREKEDNEMLWEGVRNGTIDVVATDHAPVPKEQKTNLWDALPGIPGIETFMPLMLSEGVNKNRISIQKMVEVCSANPARIFGLYPSKGSISVGADADLVIVDLDKEAVVDEKALYSGSGHSPFAGWKLKGWQQTVILRGKTVVEDGKVLEAMGWGRHIV